MNYYALISLSSAIVCFVLAFFVYYQNKKATENKVFAVFCLVLAEWAFIEFAYRQAGSAEEAMQWLASSWPGRLPRPLWFTSPLPLRKNRNCCGEN